MTIKSIQSNRLKHHIQFCTIIAALCTAILFAPNATAQTNATADSTTTIQLWPESRLANADKSKVEHNSSKPGDDIIRLADVTNPTIKVYKPTHPNGTAVVVCPGGGYYILAINLEGEEVCRWFNSFGVTAILLKYRVPTPAGLPNYQLPLQDAQRALGLVRHNAVSWGINPGHIGIMGFSAGGHLSAALSNNFTQRTYAAVDAADNASCRPDFAILVYPAYLVDKNNPGKTAPELQVTANTPPTFIMQTEDDPINVENGLYYYLALKKANVPAEIHLYPKGGHGYGFRGKTGGTAVYPQLIAKWMADGGY